MGGTPHEAPSTTVRPFGPRMLTQHWLDRPGCPRRAAPGGQRLIKIVSTVTRATGLSGEHPPASNASRFLDAASQRCRGAEDPPKIRTIPSTTRCCDVEQE